jgi:hypothetical protein
MVRRIKIMLYDSFHSFVGFYSYPFARDVAVDIVELQAVDPARGFGRD